MNKRTAAFVLTLAVALAAALLPCAAAGGMRLEVGDVQAEPSAGTEIRVPVTAQENAGYVSASLTVRWDSAALELTAVEYTDLAPDQGSPPPVNSGAYTVRIGRSAQRENFTGSGLFFTLVFRAAAGAGEGEYPVMLTDIVAVDTDLRYVDVLTAAGTVTLTGDPAPTASEGPQSSSPPTQAQPSAMTPSEEEAVPTEIQQAEITAPSAAPQPSQPSAEPTAAPASTPPAQEGGGFPWLPVLIGCAVLCGACAAFAVRNAKRRNYTKL